MNQKVCAIVVAAWQSERWIEDCLKSIEQQRTALAWRYELRLGIDACTKTRVLVDKLGYPYYWSPKNVGAYVMRNSLMLAAPASAYAVFDADDLMMDSYLTVLLKAVGTGLAGGGRITIDESGRRVVQARTGFRQGVCVISAEALKKLGGYQPERMASDADLIIRAKMLGIPVNKISQALFYRRRVSTSLTQRADTGMKSPARREAVVKHAAMRDAGKLKIVPETTPLTFFPGKRK